MHGDNDRRELTQAILGLTGVIREFSGHCATQRAIHQLEDNLLMKLSEIRQAISTASKQNKEALAELGTKIADLNAQIAELIANASDPEVTDEQFLTDLNSLREDAQALADIVPGSPTPGGGPTDGSSTPQP